MLDEANAEYSWGGFSRAGQRLLFFVIFQQIDYHIFTIHVIGSLPKGQITNSKLR